MTEFLKGDKAFDEAVRKVNSQQELDALLRDSVARSQIGYTWDAIRGQYVATGESGGALGEAIAAAPAGATDASQGEKRVVIAGKEFIFYGTPEEIQVQVDAAVTVYDELRSPDDHHAQPTAAEIEEDRVAEVLRQTELQLKMQRGEISIAKYINESGAVKDWLTSQGVDLEQLRQQAQVRDAEAYESAWTQATQKFLNESATGKLWPGGEQNQKLLQNAVLLLDLQDSPSVESLEAAFEQMKKDGTVFSHEQMQSEILKSTNDMSPEEILLAWKEQQPGYGMGDASKANAELISLFRRR